MRVAPEAEAVPFGKALTGVWSRSTLALCLPFVPAERAGNQASLKEISVPVVEETVVIARPPQEVWWRHPPHPKDRRQVRLGDIFGKLADPIVERAQGRTVRANLETLADLLAEHPAA